jgi:hypothetical protein
MRHPRRVGDGVEQRRVRLASELFELFHAGQLAHVVESEAQQEFLGGLIEDRAADDVFASGGGDELAIDERAEDAGCVDAADLADLGRGDRLLVGDDGEGFQRRQREPDGRLQALGEGAHRVVMLGLGGHAEAVGDVADLHAAVFAGVVLDELVDGGFDDALRLVAGFGGDQLGDLVERDRLFGGVDDGFDLGFSAHST